MLCATLILGGVLAEPIFNGHTLEGFEFIGPEDVWRVEDGAIIGQAEGLADQTWLYWPGPAENFHLSLAFRINAGNSGINYRSRPGGPLGMIGYQADLDAAHDWTGALYDVDGRGLMTPRGQRRRFGFQDNRQDLGALGDADALVAGVDSGQWHRYEIIADGPMLTHRINGRTVSQTWDEDPQHADQNGGIAFQLHPGEKMDVAFRDIELKHLAPTDPGDALKVPDGFTATKVIDAGPDDGSWVSMAFEPAGTLLVSPQHGRIRRVNLASGSIEPLDIDLGSSQGMVHAHDAMYVMVSRDPPAGGLHRLRDLDGDGRYDDHEHLAVWGNGSEHGPHAVVLGPDGHLWIAQGNHTPLPPRVSEDSPFQGWAEDILLERQWDANGHAVGVMSPGGVILRTDPDATAFEIVSGGLRNSCDLAFTPDGECFTWDSDMEWDMGTPWYRLPRVVHVIPGAENGWRGGTEKFQDWYPDTLPPVVETPPASPTGIVHAGDGGLGVAWDGVLLIADWSYGRIWSVRLTPHGASWRGELELFAQGRPFNVSDMAFGPDGALYVVTGGRGTASAVWRIARDEGTPTTPSVSIPPAVSRRRHLESAAAPDLDRIWTAMGTGDPAMSAAARAALTSIDPARVRDRVEVETDPEVLVDAAMGLARCGESAGRDEMLRRLCAALDASNNATTRARLLRAVAVMCVRLGRPGDTATAAIVASAVGLRDDPDQRVSRGAADLGVYLDLPEMPDWLLERMETDDTLDALYWAKLARLCTQGWTPETRLHYLRWLRRHRDLVGGRSIGGFVRAFEDRFLRDLSERDRAALCAVLDADDDAPRVRAQRAHVRAWTTGDLIATADAVSEIDVERGSRVFTEARCVECHRFRGNGGDSGPDLTGVAGRFSRDDLLRAIVEPSHALTDQYGGTLVETSDGLLHVGRLLDRDETRVVLDVDPYAGVDLVAIPRSEIVAVEPSEVSLMPVGLVDTHTSEDIAALVAWLRR